MVSSTEPQKAVSPADTPHSGPKGRDDNSGWAPRSALVGTLLANRYRITGALGQGSTGAVFRADDVLLKRPVAIRVLVPTLAQQPALIAEIRARIEQNQQRDQDALVNLVDITDVGMTLDGEVFIASDFLDGDHLSTMLARGGRLPWSRARSLLIRLGQILHAFHRQGIVVGTLEARHCYAVRAKAKQEAIKIVHNAILEHLAGAIGPGGGHGVAMLARYVAPERICGEPLDARTDVYSLGVIAYELLTGTLPFNDPNPIRLVSMHLQKTPPSPRTVAPDAAIPEAIETLLLRCLAKDPNDRFPTMEALTDALSEIPESAAEAPAADASAVATPTTPSAVADPVAAPAPAIATPVAAPAIAVAAAPASDAAAPPSRPVSPLTAVPTPAPSPVPRIPSVPAPAAAPTTSPLAAIKSTTPGLGLGNLSESGKLRLPPPPTLGGAPRGASGPVPAAGLARPPTLGLAVALPPPPALPTPAPTPVVRAASVPVPSATLPAGTVPAPAAPTTTPTPSATLAPAAAPVPSATLSPAAAPVPSATLAPAERAAPPVPSATLAPAAAPVPSATLAPAALATPPVPSATLAPAALATPPAPSATLSPAELATPPVPAASPAVPSAIVATADVSDLAESDPARMRARIAAYTADEVRRKNPLRAVPASAMAETRISPAPGRPPGMVVDDEPPAPTPVVVAAPKPEPARPQVVATPAEPALTAASLSDGQLDEPPRRRGWLVGGVIGLAVAAGIAALVLTSPSFTAERTPETPTRIAASGGVTPERAVSTPTKIAEAPSLPTAPEPDRGAAVVAPETPTTPPVVEPAPDTKAETPPETPPATGTEPPPETKPAAVDPPKKTKKRARRNYDFEDEEPREKDVFDQLREHMEAKKAAEAARAAAMAANSQPAPQPTPPPAATPPADKPDDRARETLDRARQASSSGNHSLAYTLAKQAYSIGKSLDALELMGVSACRAKNADGARTAVGSLTGTRRNAVMIACTQSGITL